MKSIEEIIKIKSPADFEQAAMETFRFQSRECAPYREYLSLIECEPSSVLHSSQIPHLPIELFKSHTIYSAEQAPEITFTSSATTGMTPSRHPMLSLRDYELSFTAAFEQFYGATSQYSIYGLLPNYLEREGSSLVYMVDRLIERCGSGGFYLHDFEKLIGDMQSDLKPKILLGVSFALWDLAEQHAPKLKNTIVMETGGMKGQREELPKEEFHKLLCEGFGVDKIDSEYGMAELTSQAYSDGGGVFRSPSWMRFSVRDINDPFEALSHGSRGGINITDLANQSSCAFIQTQDVGHTSKDGSFTIEGRIDRSDIRGCNLLVQ